EWRVSELESEQRADGNSKENADDNDEREFEVVIERKEDHENDQHGKRADVFHLVFCMKKLAVFSAPGKVITGGQGFADIGDRFLAGDYGTGEVTALDAVLHADVTRVVFAIDERRSGSLMNIGERSQGNLLA